MSETHADETPTGGTDADSEIDTAPDADVDTAPDADIDTAPDAGVDESIDTDETATDTDETTEEREDSHLDGVDAGCGCAEVWETLSEQREE